jgi:hypothetical protein
MTATASSGKSTSRWKKQQRTHDSTTEKRGENTVVRSCCPCQGSWIGAYCTRSWHGKIGCDVDVSIGSSAVKAASVAHAPTGLAACIDVRVQEPAPESLARLIYGAGCAPGFQLHAMNEEDLCEEGLIVQSIRVLCDLFSAGRAPFSPL